MSTVIVRDNAHGVNTRRAVSPDDAALIAAHARLAGLDMAGLAREILDATDGWERDQRTLTARLAAVGMAALAAGMRR